MISKHLTILPAMAALLLAAGCSNDDMDGILADGPVAAQVTADISDGQAATRTSTSGTTASFTEGDVIHVVADGTDTYEYSKQSDGSWSSDTPYYFRNTDGVSFQGWYATSAPTGNSISIDTRTQTTNASGWNKWDILATPALTTTVSTPTVNFTGTSAFKHLMSQATFIFTAGDGISDLTELTGYTLSGLIAEATFNTLTCALTAGNTTNDITQTVTGTSEKELECSPIILVPQAAPSDLTLKVTYNGLTYTTALALPDNAKALEEGTNYTFNVTIANTGLKVNAEIKDWTTPTTQDADAALYTGHLIYDEDDLIAAAKNGGSYIMMANLTLTSNLSVTAADVTLDLNGHGISGSRIEVGSSGSLTINDGSDGFAGSVNRAVWARGELTINGGTFNNIIQGISGTTTINDGIFNSSTGNDSGSSFVIKGGIFYGGVTLSCDSDDCTAVIEGGTFRGNVICSGGTISGGEFRGTVECYSGTISGGEFTCDITCSASWDGTATIDISGGTFTGDITCSASWGGTATIDISGGTFSGSLTCSAADDGYDNIATITIYGGTFYNYEPTSGGATLADGYKVTETTDDSGTTCYKVEQE